MERSATEKGKTITKEVTGFSDGLDMEHTE